MLLIALKVPVKSWCLAIRIELDVGLGMEWVLERVRDVRYV